MSEDEDKTLEDILGEESKSPLQASFETMTDGQFQKVVDAVNVEWNKRAPVRPSELNDAQFRELLRINGVS